MKQVTAGHLQNCNAFMMMESRTRLKTIQQIENMNSTLKEILQHFQHFVFINFLIFPNLCCIKKQRPQRKPKYLELLW